MTERLRSILPSIYHSLLPAFFDKPAPREEKATCSNCAMCAPAEGPAPASDVVYFRPDVKCCSYHPTLPNYLVGAILCDETNDMAEGKRRIRDKLQKRIGVTPRWLAPPKKFSVLFPISREASFGRSLVLRCPYFEADQGNCTIWRHREAVCSTFYCKYVAGADGEAFWKALDRYLRYVEYQLSEHALKTLAPHLIQPALLRDKMTLEELEERAPSESFYASVWQDWEGREEAFYVACHQHVASLNRETFDRIVTTDVYPKQFEDVIKTYDQAMNPRLPQRLKLNPDMRIRDVDSGVVVTTYSRYEPILLTADLYEVLKEFTEQETVACVRERVLRTSNLNIPEEMLISLVQLRVVIGCE